MIKNVPSIPRGSVIVDRLSERESQGKKTYIKKSQKSLFIFIQIPGVQLTDKAYIMDGVEDYLPQDEEYASILWHQGSWTISGTSFSNCMIHAFPKINFYPNHQRWCQESFKQLAGQMSMPIRGPTSMGLISESSVPVKAAKTLLVEGKNTIGNSAQNSRDANWHQCCQLQQIPWNYVARFHKHILKILIQFQCPVQYVKSDTKDFFSSKM